ncbi:MAG: rhombotarget lipoprotein [Acidobacteriota bacterium]|nr:rhombotarget lipoprotein [Acidobacteriota bacterium]
MKLRIALYLIILSTACASQTEIRRRSDLMSFLYPDASAAPAPSPRKARLQLPLRLGIAFIPSGGARPRTESPGLPEAHIDTNPVVSRQDEKKLLDIVRKTFEKRDWVREIVVIPSTYLTPRGGFDNLDQIAQMYGVDVIALASVDQIQYVNQNQIAYLSIVGSYLLPLEKNETRTLIDVAVFHVPTRTFLLRAPGVSNLKGHATSIDEPKVLRERAEAGLKVATVDLSKNLNEEVENFKTSLISGERAEVEVVNQRGVSIRSGGSFGFLDLLAALGVVVMIVLRGRS